MNKKIDPGSVRSRFGGFPGDPRRVIWGPSGIVVGLVVSVVVDSATSGKSLFTETLYVAQIICDVIVYGIRYVISLATHPKCTIKILDPVILF